MGELRVEWVALGDSARMEEVTSLHSPWGVGRGLTDEADADSPALLGPVAGVGGHTAVGSLILRPYLREEQHWAGGKGQGGALGGGRGTGRYYNPSPHIPSPVLVHLLSYPVFPSSLPASP